MGERSKTVALEINGEKQEFPRGITYREIAKQYRHTEKYDILLVMAGIVCGSFIAVQRSIQR